MSIPSRSCMNPSLRSTDNTTGASRFEEESYRTFANRDPNTATPRVRSPGSQQDAPPPRRRPRPPRDQQARSRSCAPIGHSTTMGGRRSLRSSSRRPVDPSIGRAPPSLNVGLDHLPAERELLQDVVDEADRGGLVEPVVDPKDTDPGAVVDRRELVMLLP